MRATKPETTDSNRSLPLPALLSQTLVAFTIEFDNEFEHQVPHRTTNHGSTPGFPRSPWLVSMAMWVQYLRHIPGGGIRVEDLQRLLGVSKKALDTWLTRLGKWWGYLAFDPALPAGPTKRIPPETLVRPTPGGRKAIDAWRPLTSVIENRWQKRFGDATIHDLKTALKTVVDQLDATLPDSFPILESEPQERTRAVETPHRSESTLPALLTKTLLAFALEFDRNSTASLAVCANVLRLAGDAGVRVRDLPRLACLSKEGIAAALRMVTRDRLGVVKSQPSAGKTKVLLLTPKGQSARDGYADKVRRIERDWEERVGKSTIGVLRASLEKLAVGAPGEPAPLLKGIVPYPDGWRASLPALEGLPHFPMVSHRGGFPDGS